MDNPEEVILNAELKQDFNVWSGQCLTVAEAISDFFDGEVVLVSEIPYEGFDHACVEINGNLYDGSGKVGWTETLNRFLNPKYIREDPDENFYYSENPRGKFPRAFDEELYEDIVSKLENEC